VSRKLLDAGPKLFALTRHLVRLPQLIPTSDGACEVVAVGEDVTKWAVGDRVIATFAPDYLAGEFDATYFSSLLGGQAHGMLSQYRILEDYNLVRIASHLSYEEAATLPCAALTAWNAL
jgi:NADPH:quinone reductase-like Zn-dependent oxidoreductase